MPRNTKLKTLSLEYNFTSHQMFLMSLIAIATLIISSVIGLIVSIPLFITLILTVMTKKGLATDDHQIYKGIFLFNFLLYIKRINLRNKTCFSILKFKKRQKYAFVSAANPDASHSFNTFDIYLLNKKHTEKEMLISLKKEQKSKLASDFISSFIGFTCEIYSPDFS